MYIDRLMFNLIKGLLECEETQFKVVPERLHEGLLRFIYHCGKAKRPPPVSLPEFIDILQQPVSTWGIDVKDSFPKDIQILNEQIGLSIKAKENKDEIRAFYYRVYIDTLKQYSDNINIFVHARLRRFVPDFQNGTINIGQLPLKAKHDLIKERVNFVRMSNLDDVPQYRVNPKGIVRPNVYSGLYCDSKGIYYSISQRPDSAPKNTGLLKYNSPGTFISMRRLLEIIPLRNLDLDQRDESTYLTYQMRLLKLGYDVHTNLPYPLHMLQAVKKYIQGDSHYYDKRDVEGEYIVTDDGQFAFNFE